MTLTRTAVLDVLKELYTDGIDQDLIFKDRAMLTQLEHKRDFTGRYYHIPVRYGKPQGRGKAQADAVSAEYASKYEAFQVTPLTDYGRATIAGIVVRQAAEGTGKSQFVDTLKLEMDGGLETLGDNLAKEAYGNVGGARAQVHPTTAISTTSLTLANPEDSIFFEVGMRIQAASTDGTSGSLRDSGDYITLVAVNEDTGVLTGDANWSNIASIAANDYLFQYGDFGVAGAGLAAWCPSSAPGATSFYGVDRSIQPTRLAGIRYDGSSEPMEQVFIRANARARRTRMRIKRIYVHPQRIADLEITKEGMKVINSENEYNIGVEEFRAYGTTLVPDANCPLNTAWALGENAFSWMTVGDQPKIMDDDGLQFLRASGDVYNVDLVVDYNFGSWNPSQLMRITLPTF
jgi:hypothetical protein